MDSSYTSLRISIWLFTLTRSDNFLQPRVAKFLKLSIEKAPSFKVMVGNGNYMQAEGLIQQLTVQAQGNSFTLPVFLLPIGAGPIVGASWLKGQLALT